MSETGRDARWSRFMRPGRRRNSRCSGSHASPNIALSPFQRIRDKFVALGWTGLGGGALSFGRTVLILGVAESPLCTVLPVQFLNRVLYER